MEKGDRVKGRARVLAALLSLALVLVAAVPAGAIVFGEPDGGEHPYVGMAGFYDAAGAPMHGCSGTLLSPTVFLTAAHCAAGTAGARVWFDSPLEAASGAGATGTPYSHPGFVGDTDQFGAFPETSDLGVVLLDEPVYMERYGALPEVGLLDALADEASAEGQGFTVVGYGSEGTHPDLLPAYAAPERLKNTHELADLRDALADGYNLRAPNSTPTDGFGSCHGDSGGPILLGGTDTVVAVQSFVLGEDGCAGTTGGYRTDLESSQDFVRGFLG